MASGICGSTETVTGDPCSHPVNATTVRCAAGHLVVPTGSTSAAGAGRFAGATGGIDLEQLTDEVTWYDPDELDVAKRGEHAVSQNRIEGALLGLAAGDCLGASVEFMSADEIRKRFPRGHRDIIGGGPFAWRPGQGTDDSDLTMALAEAYARDEGFTIKAAADGFLEWKRSGPRDIGGTTASALSKYGQTGDPASSGRTDDRSAANGGLMRAIATGLVRRDPEQRRAEARRVSAITHAEPRCLDAATIYCDIAGRLMDGDSPDEAIDWALENSPASDQVKRVVQAARSKRPEQLDSSGYVLGSLEVAVWAVSQRGTSLEDTLVKVVSLGKDTDTTGAIAGGLLGAAYGASAVPKRWVDKLEYAPRIKELSGRLADVRFENGTPARPLVHARSDPAARRGGTPTRRRGLLRRLLGR